MNLIAEFVKKRRKQAGLTQEEFAMKAGVALTVIRKIEQGKGNLSLSKVNQVLKMFGHILGPIVDKWFNVGWVLSPAYDLLNLKMILPKDKENMALLLGGKKENFSKKYFDRFGALLELNEK